MSGPSKPPGSVTTFTYDIADLRDDASHTNVSTYDTTELELPVRQRTTTVYEDDGHGSAVLRENVEPRGPVQKARRPPTQSS